MLAALRKARVICGWAAFLAFATIAASHLIALAVQPQGPGFLGAAEPFVFIVACVLLGATVLSIPFLRQQTPSGGSTRSHG